MACEYYPSFVTICNAIAEPPRISKGERLDDRTRSPRVCAILSDALTVDRYRGDEKNGGTLILRSRIVLTGVSGTICSYLPHWAQEAPDRVFLAQRTSDNVWQQISYGEFWSRVRSVGQTLIDRGGAAGDTLAILPGNSIENAVIQFAAMSVGLQVAPISPNYSLLPGGLSRIEEIAKVLCVAKTLSELMPCRNHLSWRNDRAFVFRSGRLGFAIQVEDEA
jgi:hypothetical protein